MKKIFELVKSDYQRYTGNRGGVIKIIQYLLFSRNHCFNYTFWLRFCNRRNPLFMIALLMHKRLTVKYGIQIPRNTKIGYGFYIGHGIGIVINPTTIIGNNCNISQFTTIGSNDGNAAVIGDNVYIGPSVCIVENVKIGNNVTIGAGSVVTRDIPENATVAGVPSRILNYNNPGRYISNRYNYTEQ